MPRGQDVTASKVRRTESERRDVQSSCIDPALSLTAVGPPPLAHCASCGSSLCVCMCVCVCGVWGGGVVLGGGRGCVLGGE